MKTERTELVETHNLALALKRLYNVKPFDTNAWRRALYHAMAMNFQGDDTMLARIRSALELP